MDPKAAHHMVLWNQNHQFRMLLPTPQFLITNEKIPDHFLYVNRINENSSTSKYCNFELGSKALFFKSQSVHITFHNWVKVFIRSHLKKKNLSTNMLTWPRTSEEMDGTLPKISLYPQFLTVRAKCDFKSNFKTGYQKVMH